MADVTERIEKQMEGTNLALAAVAEVLQKMDARLSKEENDTYAQAQANSQEAAKADLVKSIATQVLSVIKQEAGNGLDVSGGERKAKATGGTPKNSDDSESATSPTTKIEDQQNTIQASLRKEEDDEDEDEIEEKGGMSYKQDDDEADDEAADMPETEEKGMDDEDDEDDSDEIKSMRKQIAKLQKEVQATQGNMQKAVTAEAENRLRKMGFREENGLKAPQITNGLGLDTTPLIKSQDSGDVASQLADLSYKQLRDLQYKIETGDTDGVPRELLG
jgi:hypothetical protein